MKETASNRTSKFGLLKEICCFALGLAVHRPIGGLGGRGGAGGTTLVAINVPRGGGDHTCKIGGDGFHSIFQNSQLEGRMLERAAPLCILYGSPPCSKMGQAYSKDREGGGGGFNLMSFAVPFSCYLHDKQNFCSGFVEDVVRRHVRR